MSEIINKFNIFCDFRPNFKQDIKLFHVSRYSGYCVLNDNTVYGLGEGIHESLGYNNSREKYVLIKELNDKNIIEFYQGYHCMFARNNNDEIFSWGMNNYGQLARGILGIHEEFFKPEKISFFDGKCIIEISFGYTHCLALSSDGRVFGWGNNGVGQVGCGEEKGKIILNPIEIDLKEKIKLIHCARSMSFAVTFDGNPYYWGSIDLFNPGEALFTPKLIPIKNVKKVYCDSRDIIIIYINCGKVFEFNSKNGEIIETKYQKTNKKLIEENGIKKLIETDLDNFFNCKLQKPRDYNKTIKLTKDGYLMIKEIHFNENEKELNLIDKYFFQIYEILFEEINEIGRGSFGNVYKVKQKTSNKYFAIKKVELNDDNHDVCLKEIKILSEQDSHFVVEYIDSWIDGHLKRGSIERFLFIQMELCEHNLRDFIKLMIVTFEENFKTFQYFISCELFKELIECVKYLHELNSPIIHRDLKPENILISNSSLKLCDFGLAMTHEKSSHSRNVGTYKYMAPEVLHSRKYNTKCDVYSLALIATEIFLFEDSVTKIRDYKKQKDFEQNLHQYSNGISNKDFKKLFKILSKCLLPKNYNFRPNCKQLLENIKELSITKDCILNDSELEQFKNNNNNMISEYFQTKLQSDLCEDSHKVTQTTFPLFEGLNDVQIYPNFFNDHNLEPQQSILPDSIETIHLISDVFDTPYSNMDTDISESINLCPTIIKESIFGYLEFFNEFDSRQQLTELKFVYKHKNQRKNDSLISDIEIDLIDSIDEFIGKFDKGLDTIKSEEEFIQQQNELKEEILNEMRNKIKNELFDIFEKKFTENIQKYCQTKIDYMREKFIEKNKLITEESKSELIEILDQYLKDNYLECNANTEKQIVDNFLIQFEPKLSTSFGINCQHFIQYMKDFSEVEIKTFKTKQMNIVRKLTLIYDTNMKSSITEEIIKTVSDINEFNLTLSNLQKFHEQSLEIFNNDLTNNENPLMNNKDVQDKIKTIEERKIIYRSVIRNINFYSKEVKVLLKPKSDLLDIMKVNDKQFKDRLETFEHLNDEELTHFVTINMNRVFAEQFVIFYTNIQIPIFQKNVENINKMLRTLKTDGNEVKFMEMKEKIMNFMERLKIIDELNGEGFENIKQANRDFINYINQFLTFLSEVLVKNVKQLLIDKKQIDTSNRYSHLFEQIEGLLQESQTIEDLDEYRKQLLKIN